MIKYVLMFGGIYLLCLILAIGTSLLLGFELPSAMGIIVLIAAMAPVVQKFVRDHRRVLTLGERTTLATGIGVAVIILNLGLAGIAFYAAKIFVGDTNPFAYIQGLLDMAARDGFSAPVVFLGLAAISFVVSWLAAFFYASFGARASLKRLSAS